MVSASLFSSFFRMSSEMPLKMLLMNAVTAMSITLSKLDTNWNVERSSLGIDSEEKSIIFLVKAMKETLNGLPISGDWEYSLKKMYE